MDQLQILFWFLVLIFGTAFAWKPRYALSVLPILFPTYLWRIDLFGMPTNFIEALIFLAFAIWFVQVTIGRQKSLLDFKFLKKWIWVILLILIGSVVGLIVAKQGILTLPNSGRSFDSFRVALGIFKGWVIAPLMYFVMFGSLANRDLKKWSFNGYLLSAFVLAFWGLIQIATGDYITIDERVSGPFLSANYLALYIAPAVLSMLLLAWRYYEQKNARMNALYGFAFIFMFSALIGTRSYGAFLGILIGALFYFVYSFRSWKKIGVVFLTALVVFSFFAYTQKDTEKFQVFFDFDQRSSSSVRLQTWQIAGSLIMQHPFEGIGLGQFEPQYELQGAKILGRETFESTQLHPHNIFFSFWLNFGFFGILALIFILLNVLKMSQKLGKDKERLFFISIFLALFVHGLVDQPFFKNDLSLFWWLIIGLL